MRDAVILGPVFKFEAFRAVLQDDLPDGHRVLREDWGQFNYAGNNFGYRRW